MDDSVLWFDPRLHLDLGLADVIADQFGSLRVGLLGRDRVPARSDHSFKRASAYLRF